MASHAPVQAEVVHESERVRLTRLPLAGRSCIRKEPLGWDAPERLRHEAAVLARLRGVDGVVQQVETAPDAEALMLEDLGDTSLARIAKPLAIDDLTALALQLAKAVAGMHRRGIMHRDIAPANIVVVDKGTPCLIDFALATAVAELRPDFTHHTEIVGTLAYLAPEQSGRTGRPVDQRADLYALGATLYELATAEPPFGSGDPLRLTHDHLARVPVPPAEVNPAVPASLSDIILHLLEKEPDDRYQTADGLIYDLERLQGDATAPTKGLRVGQHDFPARLLPPSRLVGRDDDVALLRAAFEAAKSGQCRGVLVGGAAGVGKTALVDELRPVATSSDGWFVMGKFDQYRRDLDFDAVNQALRALGRLLLAEPEEELAKIRGRILRSVRPNTGLLTATVPEFAALLGVPPDPGDPLTAQLRTQRAIVEVLRAVSTAQRPVVFFVDDLQWAGRTALGLIELALSEDPIDGLLLAGAYRDADADGSQAFAATVSRWRQQPELKWLRLENLRSSSSVTMVAETLRVQSATAAGLADAINPYTQGNPYETVELLNALRRDGVLVATPAGWQWDDAAVRAHLGESKVGALLAARVDAMPPASQKMVEAMACLGGRADRVLLQTAIAEPTSVLEQMLTPALDEGLLVVEPGAHQAVRFRHDRTRDVVLGALSPDARTALQLSIARRLAAVPELFAVAAEQYLAVADRIDDGAERRQVVELLRRAAEQATLTGDHALVNSLLTAALQLIDDGDRARLIEVHTGRHAALYGMGRLDEADEEYRIIEDLSTSVTERAEAAVVQVLSLTQRTRLADAIGFGLELLRELGITVPTADRLAAELDQQFTHLYRWLDETEAADDLARPDITEPRLLAATRVINTILPPTFFVADHATNAWLSLETLRIWRERGPGRTLVGPASTAAFATVTQRGDIAAGYRAVRRILALSEARGYEPDTSQARFYYSVLCSWFEPVENSVLEGQRARDGLIAGGDPANAGYCWQSIVAGLLDCAQTLDTFLVEVESGLAFARRTGSEQSGQWLDSYRWLASTLRGQGAADAEALAPIDTYASNPLALLFAHITRALAAEFFSDAAGLARHTAAAMPLLPIVSGHYVTGVAYLLRGLALAGQIRTDGEPSGELRSELDRVIQWLDARAASAPANFLHMLRLLEAERAWALGDFQAAAHAFDAAQREAGQRQRPWHRALIAEHAGRFYLAHNLEHTAYDLLAQARQNYLAWGATGKVHQLDWAYPVLRLPVDATTEHGGDPTADLASRRATLSTGTIDLLGILSASQALSSENTIDGLHARVVEVLSAMTGATGVQLLMWSEDQQDWLVPTPCGEADAVPASVLRFVQRTREPLVTADATRDERFARDPYFSDADCCSLLALPIVSRGALTAMLLLENRLMRGAFTKERLDAVMLIAGQLAVSLDNAQLYGELGRVADEQAALRRVATLVARGADSADVFAAVTEELCRHLGVVTAGLWRAEESGEITLVAATAAPEFLVKWPLGTRTPVEGNNLASVVIASGQPARMDTYDSAVGAVADRVRSLGVRAAVGVPVVVDGRVWGVAVVGTLTPGPMADGTEARIADFADLAAAAIAAATAHADLQESRDQLRVLAEQQAALRRVATLVARGVSPSEVFAGVADELAGVLHVVNAGLLRYEPDGTGYVVAVRYEAEVTGMPLTGDHIPLAGDDVGSRILHTGRAARIDNHETAKGPEAERIRAAGIGSIVGVPVVVNGRLWGAAIVGSRGPETMPANTEGRIADFADLVATAIANAAARSQLQASRDALRVLADQQAALRRVATLVARGVSPAEVFGTVVEEMARCLRVGHAALFRYDTGDALTPLAVYHRGLETLPKGLRLRLDAEPLAATVLSTRASARIDVSEDAPASHGGRIRGLGIHSAVAAPITVDERIWGVAIAGSLDPEPLPLNTEARIHNFADLVATAIANAATRTELVASRTRIVTAADQARRRLERNLHDGAQQRLVSLAIALRAAEAEVSATEVSLKAQLSNITTGLADVSDDLREIARGIHPAILSKGGLGPALKTLARRSSVPVTLEATIARRLPEPVEVAAYYVVAEALTNAAKHAHATEITVSAETAHDDLRLLVQDNGIGGADATKGSGLVGLKDRVEALGGRVHLSSPAAQGTSLIITIPLDGR